MSEDEVIEVLKDFKKRINTWHAELVEEDIQAIETILDLYQKQKEKIEAMNKGIDELVREKQDLKTQLYMNSVSKDKIKDIIYAHEPDIAVYLLKDLLEEE